MPHAVLDMRDLRAAWAMPSWVPAHLREALGDEWDLFVAEEETDGSGDGGSRLSPRVLDAVRPAEVYFGFGIPAALLEAGPALRWVHSGAAGVGSSLTPVMKERPVVLTNSAGVHAPPMAETVLGMILYFLRGLDFAVRGQREGVWSTEPYFAGGGTLRELTECTVGIVGFGGIGREVARRVAALGARVVACKRTPLRAGETDLETVAGGARLGGQIEVGHGPAGLEAVLTHGDVVVLCAPETPETRGMLDASALGRLKDGAVLVNVARGRLVDETALERELRSGRIRGAGLDVFAQEPLPEGHPFWSLPNVLLTPHVSAVTRGFWAREIRLIEENVRRYLAGEPLLNTVDKSAGY